MAIATYGKILAIIVFPIRLLFIYTIINIIM